MAPSIPKFNPKFFTQIEEPCAGNAKGENRGSMWRGDPIVVAHGHRGVCLDIFQGHLLLPVLRRLQGSD